MRAIKGRCRAIILSVRIAFPFEPILTHLSLHRFLVMTDEWFEEYVFQIVAPREFVDRDVLAIYDDAPHSVKVLPMWDTLGESSLLIRRVLQVLIARLSGSRLLRLAGVSQQIRRSRKAFANFAYIASLSCLHFP